MMETKTGASLDDEVRSDSHNDMPMMPVTGFELEDDRMDPEPYGQETEAVSAAEGDDEDEDENIWVKNVRNFPLSPATVDCKRECSMAFRTQPPWMHFGTRSRRKQTDMPGMLIFYPGHFHSFILCTCVCFGCMGVKVAHVIVKTGVV